MTATSHPLSAFAVHAYAEATFRARLEAKDAVYTRAVCALRLEAAKLKDERERARAVIADLEQRRAHFRGASQGAYVAILSLIRARKLLGGVA